MDLLILLFGIVLLLVLLVFSFFFYNLNKYCNECKFLFDEFSKIIQVGIREFE